MKANTYLMGVEEKFALQVSEGFSKCTLNNQPWVNLNS